MCTNPITIKRNYPSIGTREYVIPCGKCAECTNKKQAEFGALALHAALKADSLHFFTLTYRNEALPFAISEEDVFTDENGKEYKDVRVLGFERGCDGWANCPATEDSPGFYNSLIKKVDSKGNPFFVAASLHREDVKNWLKEFRREWKKLSCELPDFSYAIFGEFGEQRGRPHYHGLFFGLTSPQVKMLSDIWQRRFGFTYVIPPNFNRKLSIDEIKAVSRYTSKYISKGVHTRWQHLLPYVEKPRRQSSLNFGNFSEAELSQFCDFTFAAICSQLMAREFQTLLSWSVSYLDGSLSKLLASRSLYLKD